MTYNPTTILTTKMQNDFDCCAPADTDKLHELSNEIFRTKHSVKTLKTTSAYNTASNYFEFTDYYLQTLINTIL